jgi:2-dehydropantoate 2-reductase
VQILVVGAGAVGSVVATSLARAGEEVSLLVRPAAVPESGRLKTQIDVLDHEPQWAIVPVASEVAEPPDCILLCVKAPDFAAAASALAPVPASIPVMALHAAPTGDEVLASALRRPVIGGIFGGSAAWLAPGCARVLAPRLQLARAAEQVPGVVAMLQRALPITVVEEIVSTRWAHLFATLPQAVGALVNRPLAEIAEDRTVQHLATALWTEAARVFAKADIPLTLPDYDLGRLGRLHATLGIFTGRVVRQESALLLTRGDLPDPLLQSLRRRQPTESDALHGALVRLGAQMGLPTPATARMVELLARVATTGTFLTIDQMRQAIGRL